MVKFRIYVYSLKSEYEVNSAQLFHISDQITDLDLFVMIYLHVKHTTLVRVGPKFTRSSNKLKRKLGNVPYFSSYDVFGVFCLITSKTADMCGT
jgi:hypothetical protein